MTKTDKSPVHPLFDSLAYIKAQPYEDANILFQDDYQYAKNFLLAYDGSSATFNAYRREVERLLQWTWWIKGQSVLTLKRGDIEEFLGFCKSPKKSWITTKKVPKFVVKDGLRKANKNWRPFVATISKVKHRKGETPKVEDYELSPSALQDIFSILSSFFNFLIMEDITEINPVASIRQKSKFIRKSANQGKIRRLTDKQWQYVLETAEMLANQFPETHERTLFIMSALYGMYLRISELVASDRWTPTMNDFWQDYEKRWWFTTVGKGNKERQITVSYELLEALKRWRTHLNLSVLPTPADNSVLLPKVSGKGAISSTTYLREIVQKCFDAAAIRLKEDKHFLEAENLIEATVHWLRHTGISDDVKQRPREHVRDDAGHSSSAITDKYIDIHLKERHESGVNKSLKQENEEDIT